MSYGSEWGGFDEQPSASRRLRKVVYVGLVGLSSIAISAGSFFAGRLYERRHPVPLANPPEPIPALTVAPIDRSSDDRLVDSRTGEQFDGAPNYHDGAENADSTPGNPPDSAQDSQPDGAGTTQGLKPESNLPGLTDSDTARNPEAATATIVAATPVAETTSVDPNSVAEDELASEQRAFDETRIARNGSLGNIAGDQLTQALERANSDLTESDIPFQLVLVGPDQEFSFRAAKRAVELYQLAIEMQQNAKNHPDTTDLEMQIKPAAIEQRWSTAVYDAVAAVIDFTDNENRFFADSLPPTDPEDLMVASVLTMMKFDQPANPGDMTVERLDGTTDVGVKYIASNTFGSLQ